MALPSDGDINSALDINIGISETQDEMMQCNEPDDHQSISFSEQTVVPFNGDYESDFNSISETAASTIDNSSEIQLQKLLDELVLQHEVMEDEIKTILLKHIPSTVEKLTGEKRSMDRWHKATNVVTIFGAGAGLAGLFIPVAGAGIAIGGSVIAFTAWLVDLYNKRKTKKITKKLQEEFEENCQAAKIAYETVMTLFCEYCEEYAKYNPEGLDLNKLQTISTPKQTSSKDTLEQAKIPAIQSVSCGTALGDLANTITSLVVDVEENTTKFVSFLQKVGPIASKIAFIAPILGGVCSGYVLLDTALNFFKPCKASQDIDAYVQKLNNFGTELYHLLDKSNLSIMLLKSETNRAHGQKQIRKLEEKCKKLQLYHEEEMAVVKQHHTEEMEYQTQQHQDMLEALSQQYHQNLYLQQKSLENERQLHIQKLKDEKKHHEDILKQTQQQHAKQLSNERKQYKKCLKQEKQRHLKELEEERQQHSNMLRDEKEQFMDNLKAQEEQSKKTIEEYKNMLDAFLKK